MPRHPEDALRVVHETVQVRRVPGESVISLPPEQGLVRLIALSTHLGQGRHGVHVVVRGDLDGLGVHASHCGKRQSRTPSAVRELGELRGAAGGSDIRVAV